MPSLSGFLSTRVVGPTPFFLISSEHLVVRMKVPDSALPSGWASHFQASAVLSVAGIKLPQGQCTAPSEPDVGNSSESTPGLLSSNGFWIGGGGGGAFLMITFQKFQQFATLVPPLRLRVEVPKATSVTSGITKQFHFLFPRPGGWR